jgi:hypothetical protein
MANSELWKRVENGIHQAEITIIDPRSYRDFAIAELLEQQAEPGIDFDVKTINEISGQYIIEWSPVGRLGAFDLDWIADNTNFQDGTDFTTRGLNKRAGGKLRDAVVLAARSHAMVSPSELSEILSNSFGGGVIDFQTRMKHIGEVTRVFDVEHPRSIPILNEFAERLAHAAGVPRSLTHAMNRKAGIWETSSHDVDHIQAADLAAGYHTLSEPARAEYCGAPFHTHPMPECHKRAADLAGHRPAVTFSGQSDRQHATLAYRRMRLTVVNLGRS